MILKGTDVVLEVFFDGYPKPNVVWKRADHPIDDINICIIVKHGYSALLITDINTNQSGQYTAIIINIHGNKTISTSVAVEGPPDPPGGDLTTFVGIDWVRVAWCSSSYDGCGVLSGAMLEMQCNDSEWLFVDNVLNTLSYTVRNLIPLKRYKFRIRAQNTYGNSEPSKESQTVSVTSLINTVETSLNENFDNIDGNIFKQQFHIFEELGRGRFGVVHRVSRKDTGMMYAAKFMKCIKINTKKKIRDEIDIMRLLQHPKFIHLIECFETSRETILIMEFISGGELFERVVADDFTLTEKDCVIFVHQICEAVQYMHSMAVVHLDLKPENIMCKTRESRQIKIIDFGLAQHLHNDTTVRVLLGTPEFVAPEIINYEPIGLQSDMWSIGVICYVLLSGLSPFMGETDADTFNNITRAEYDFDDNAFDIVSEEAKEFISGLLQHRKEDRLTATQCLKTKWLSLDNNILEKSKICTRKLKKFIVRRKWQKTGNAIRALGRMASLSATRRNSSTTSASQI